jgi:peptidoglycan hydrolase CwlO-like protein
MSKLNELWKSIGDQLHMPQLTKPMWEEVMAQLDALNARVADLEKLVANSASSLDPALIAELSRDWSEHQARQMARAQKDAAEQAAQAAAEAEVAEAEKLLQAGDKASADPADSGADVDKAAGLPAPPETSDAGDLPAGDHNVLLS